jgi:hypothetical protein
LRGNPPGLLRGALKRRFRREQTQGFEDGSVAHAAYSMTTVIEDEARDGLSHF